MPIVLDVETAGLKPEHPLIQIAALAADANYEEQARFEAKLRFEERLADPAALHLNHYDRSVWEREAIEPLLALSQFSGFLRKWADMELTSKGGKRYPAAKAIAYNAHFDSDRLRAAAEPLNVFLPMRFPVMCAMQRAMWYVDDRGLESPKYWRLSAVCLHFGVEQGEAHDALGDCVSTLNLLRFFHINVLQKATA